MPSISPWSRTPSSSSIPPMPRDRLQYSLFPLWMKERGFHLQWYVAKNRIFKMVWANLTSHKWLCCLESEILFPTPNSQYQDACYLLDWWSQNANIVMNFPSVLYPQKIFRYIRSSSTSIDNCCFVKNEREIHYFPCSERKIGCSSNIWNLTKQSESFF